MKYKRTLYSSGAPLEVSVGYSRAIKLGDFVFVGGTTAVQSDGTVHGEGDAYEQTKYILEKMESFYLKAGAKREDVFRVKMYVTDISRAMEFIKAYSEFYKQVKPVCTMVETPKLNRPTQLIEIEIDALIGSAATKAATKKKVTRKKIVKKKAVKKKAVKKNTLKNRGKKAPVRKRAAR